MRKRRAPISPGGEQLLRELVESVPISDAPILRPVALRSVELQRRQALAGYVFRNRLDTVLLHAEWLLGLILVLVIGTFAARGPLYDWLFYQAPALAPRPVAAHAVERRPPVPTSAPPLRRGTAEPPVAAWDIQTPRDAARVPHPELGRALPSSEEPVFARTELDVVEPAQDRAHRRHEPDAGIVLESTRKTAIRTKPTRDTAVLMSPVPDAGIPAEPTRDTAARTKRTPATLATKPITVAVATKPTPAAVATKPMTDTAATKPTTDTAVPTEPTTDTAVLMESAPAVAVPTEPTPVPPLDPTPLFLEAPAARLQAKVVEVFLENDVWQVADYAAGYHHGTGLPGEGNLVMAGHKGVRGAVFAKLEALRTGDEVFVDTADQRFRYRVRETRRVWPSEVEVMYPTPTPTLTLLTCTNWDLQRFVVVADLVDSAPRTASTGG